MITHDGGKCAGLIVGVAHKGSDPGMNAEGAKEIAGDVFAIACIDGAIRSRATDSECALPACSAARSANSGVCSRKFL